MDIRSKIQTFIAITAVIGLVILFHMLGWLVPVERFLRQIITPGSEMLYTITVTLADDETKEFHTVDELKDAYERLMVEYKAAQVAAVNSELIRQENSELRNLVGFFSSTTMYHRGAEVVANTVGKNIESVGSTLVINKGGRHGIRIGNPVIVETGILIGKVIRVEDDLSIVQLITDSQSKIAAMVMNGDKSIGIVEGGYNISTRMTWIPQNETVSVGDIVVTSGLENGIPRGLLIGRIAVIEREPYQAFQEAEITPLANLGKLRLVAVIIGS